MSINFNDKELQEQIIDETDVAHAGRSEKSDIMVAIQKRDNGGISLDIKSSVKSMFGSHIRKTVENALQKLGVENAAVEVDDKGALDYVIQARIEAAARRLWTVKEPDVLPEKRIQMKPVAKDRLRRTRLYLPGNNPDLMLNAGLFGSDCVILDLEDSVALADKADARVLVRNSLLALDFSGSERIVRINPMSTDYGPKDLEMIVQAEPDTLLIPKCECKDDVSAVEEMVIYLEQQAKLNRSIFFMPLIETAKGVLRAYEIATASDRVVALCFGAEDFTADIGAERTPDGRESFVARSMLVLAAKAAGVQAIDTVYSDVDDIEGLVKSTEEAISLGFDGKGVIHPGQIKPIHDTFTPTPERIEYARKVIKALREAEDRGLGVASLGGKMIDAPVAARANKILALAKAMGLINNED